MKSTRKLVIASVILYVAGAAAIARAQTGPFCCTFEASSGTSACTDGIEDIQLCIGEGENPGIGDCDTGCVTLPFCCAGFLGSSGLCYDGPPLPCAVIGGTPGFICQSDGTCAIPLVENPL